MTTVRDFGRSHSGVESADDPQDLQISWTTHYLMEEKERLEEGEKMLGVGVWWEDKKEEVVVEKEEKGRECLTYHCNWEDDNIDTHLQTRLPNLADEEEGKTLSVMVVCY